MKVGGAQQPGKIGQGELGRGRLAAGSTSSAGTWGRGGRRAAATA